MKMTSESEVRVELTDQDGLTKSGDVGLKGRLKHGNMSNF